MKEWFGTWFNSPYYHLLYQHRDHGEAEEFIRRLVGHLNPPKGASCLDLACGKGRHSIQLNKLGFNVVGADYSPESIQEAKQHEKEGLFFVEHDMRQPLARKYDYILNLFTSFGYFDTEEEHTLTLQNIYNALNQNGMFVLDYLNAHNVISGLVGEDELERGSIQFSIRRKFTNHRIIKSIAVHHNGNTHHFSESVMAFTCGELEAMAASVGFNVVERFGDYDLSPYAEESNRCILVLKK